MSRARWSLLVLVALDFMPFKLFLTLSVASSDARFAGCVGHMRSPSPYQRSLLWCSARRLSRCGSALLPPARVPHEPAPATTFDSAPSPPGLAPPCVAFFGLEGLTHLRFVTLKAGVLVQRGPPRVADGLPIGDFLVMGLPGVRAAQIADPPRLGVHDHDVLSLCAFFFPL